MAIALAGLPPYKVFVHIDVIIVVGSSERIHPEYLKQVFEIPRTTSLKLKPEKCKFFFKEVIYLGHLCTSEGVKPKPKKIRAIVEFPRPGDGDAAKRFVAAANYWRRSIKNIAKSSRPLAQLSRKRVPLFGRRIAKNHSLNLKNA